MNHKLIANFSQVGVMASKVGNSAAATQGACHNFSIEWISLMFTDNAVVSNSAAQNRMKRLSLRGGAGNPVLQKVFGQRWGEGAMSYKIADRMMISLRGLKEKSLRLDYSLFDQNDLINKIIKTDASGMIYSFWFNGSVSGAPGGAHTIGFFRPLVAKRGQLVPNSDFICAFDPNLGEFYIPEADFNNWFNQFKQAYGGSFHHHMLKTVST